MLRGVYEPETIEGRRAEPPTLGPPAVTGDARRDGYPSGSFQPPQYAGGVPLSNYAKDKLIAPEMSKFTSATIRDMSDVDAEQEHWLANYILNRLFRANVNTPYRQQWYNFLRRSHSAFAAYALARKATLEFLNEGRDPLRYVDAIGHWEAFLGYFWQAHCFLGRGQKIWFEKGDGSPRERVLALHNRAKHADEAIERGEFVEDSPLCVWLTNDGLRSTETSLSFDEMASLLDDLAKWASAVQDPATMREKLGLSES